MLRSKSLLITASFAVGCLLATLDARAGAISGVCPDGSIFIVQQAESIPCRNAKRVDPADIPPLAPEFLPRPYGWDVFNRETDPNNPYNLVDPARTPAPVTARSAPVVPPLAGTPPAPPISVGLAPQGAMVASASHRAPALSLAQSEIEDLAAIVGVLQDRAPATLVQRGQEGTGLEMRFARSSAFEARVRQALAARGSEPAGPVIAFHVIAEVPGAFWGNLTFVQGHVAHHPDPTDPAEFGLVDGRLGELSAGDRVLGYAVLPANTDLREPLDVYWNDRLLTATLAPATRD